MFPQTYQDESRSISENSTWGIRRRFEQGKLHINHNKFLGYDKDKDGYLVINEEQAKIMRRIYREFLNGKGTNRIAKDLEREGVPNWHGKAKWYEGSIRKMLTNEDVLLQKTYTVDFLSKKRADNTGQVPQYYVEDSHPAIIDKDTWEAVHLEIQRRKAYAAEHSIQKLEYATTDNPFAGRVICGICGRIYGRKVWNSTDERLRRIVWRCNGKYPAKGEKGCDSRHIDDGILYQAFVCTFNTLIENKGQFLDKWEQQLKSEDSLRRYKAKRYIDLSEDSVPIREFNVDLYFALVEKMTVHKGNLIRISLLDGTDVECEV